MPKCHIAGKPIVLDYGQDIEAMIANRLRSFVWPQVPGDSSDVVSHPTLPSDYDGGRFTLPYGDPPSPRVNEWIHPTGVSRYGRGLLLLDKEGMAALAAASFGYVGSLAAAPASWGTTAGPVTFEVDYGGSSFSRLVTPLAPMAIETASLTELWIVPIVDVRYRWLNFFPETIDFTGQGFDDLLDIYEAIIGITITHPAIDNRFGIVEPRAFYESYVSLAVAIDALLLSVGLRGYVQAGTQNIIAQSAATAIARLDAIFAEPEITLGGSSPKVNLPESIQVSGPKSHNYVECETWYELATVPGGDASVTPLGIWTTFCEHEFTASGTATAQSQCQAARDALLEVLGETAAAWNSRRGFLIAPGVRLWHDCTCLDYVSILLKGSDSIYTSAVTLPADFFPRVNFSQWNDHYVHLPAGSGWWLRAGAGVPGVSDPFTNAPASADCQVCEFDSLSGTITPALTYTGTATQPIPVLNNTTGTIGPGVYFEADTVGCDAVVTPAGSQSPGVAIIQFRTTYKMVGGKADAIVEDVIGWPMLNVGDPVEVTDRNMLWVDVEANATGWAYWNPDPPDSPITGGVDESVTGQWDIFQCSLTVDEMEGELTTCLKKTDLTGDVAITWQADPPRLRSGFPAVDVPEEVLDEVNPFTPLNKWKLDGVTGSKVIVRRITTRGFSRPDILAASGPPFAPNAIADTTHTWEIVKVEKFKARHIKAAKNGSLWDLVSYYEGEDPTVCGDLIVNCLFDCSCLDNGDEVVAFYDPNTDEYYAHATASAMLGPPDTLPMVNSVAFSGSGCELNTVYQNVKVFTCGSSPVLSSTSPTLLPVTTVIGASLTAQYGLCFNYATLMVCAVEPSGQVCFPVTVDCPDPAVTCAQNTCEYTWDAGLEEWVLTKPCPAGCTCTGPPLFPGTTPGEVKSFPCSG